MTHGCQDGPALVHTSSGRKPIQDVAPSDQGTTGVSAPGVVLIHSCWPKTPRPAQQRLRRALVTAPPYALGCTDELKTFQGALGPVGKQGKLTDHAARQIPTAHHGPMEREREPPFPLQGWVGGEGNATDQKLQLQTQPKSIPEISYLDAGRWKSSLMLRALGLFCLTQHSGHATKSVTDECSVECGTQLEHCAHRRLERQKTAQDVGSHRTPSRFTNLPEGNISLEINNDKPTPSQLFWVPATKVSNLQGPDVLPATGPKRTRTRSPWRNSLSHRETHVPTESTERRRVLEKSECLGQPTGSSGRAQKGGRESLCLLCLCPLPGSPCHRIWSSHNPTRETHHLHFTEEETEAQRG
ncbi:uncharacterized protein LOC105235975 isoform X2 [Ailuropoda melanoleuca]|uniref:uncharacterized protein LOC105235975 isoform X2 n=1 Tax=Ailuropoda melanoleuca TaxID=9646 RepID=UPI001494008A|nr:uncharacterized protein LOC105235975 isoform X2 [Ailuropoda melanoleuca]